MEWEASGFHRNNFKFVAQGSSNSYMWLWASLNEGGS